MAFTKSTLVLAIICIMFIQELEIVAAEQIDCNAKCERRCSLSWKHKMCMRACNTCCQRCNCVPPGPTSSKEMCPCYAEMKTHGGRYKCP